MGSVFLVSSLKGIFPFVQCTSFLFCSLCFHSFSFEGINHRGICFLDIFGGELAFGAANLVENKQREGLVTLHLLSWPLAFSL